MPKAKKTEKFSAASVEAGDGSVGVGGNVVKSTIITGPTVIHQAAPPLPEIHDTIGFVPPANAEAYVYRGKIEEDIRKALRVGGTSAIVGLHAPGGTGKTELAACIAREVKDGKFDFKDVLWVDVNDKTPQETVAHILRLLGVTLPLNADYADQKQTLHSLFKDRCLLVILDDVRENAVHGLRDFLPSSPCSALITSRIREIGGVKEFPLDHMEPDQARELFVNSLGEDAVKIEEATVYKLAERCKHNPLALEIASKRIRQNKDFASPIAKYYEKAKKRFEELKMHGDDRWNMTGVFDLSYNDLSEADQNYFRALAVFAPTGFAPQAAAHLWELEEGRAGEVISRFINLSLVIPVKGDFERFRLHDLLDEYAALKLNGREAEGEEEQTESRLAEWLIDLFDEHYTDDSSNAPEVGLEFANLAKTAEWAIVNRKGALLASLATKPRNWLYNYFRQLNDWLNWLETSLEIGVEDKQLQANVLQAIGDVQQFRDDRDAALVSYNEALKLFKEIGAKLGEANVLQAIGDVQQFRDDRDAALVSYNEALKLFKEIGAKLGEANVYLSLGGSKRANKDFVGARVDFENSLKVYRMIGDQYSQARALYRLGDCLSDEEKYKEALENYEKAAQLWKAIGVNDLVDSILMPRIAAAKENRKLQ